MQQPPLKKLATKGPMGSLTANSVPVDMSGTSGGYAANIQVTDSSFPSISKTFSNENVRGISARRDGVASQGHKSSAVLQQAWKEEFDTGNLLPLLYEYFGESMLNFVPTPEFSLLL